MRPSAWFTFGIVGVCVGLASVASAQGRGKPSPPPPVPVAVTIHDFDENSAHLLLQSDGIDGGVYGNAGGIIAYIASGDGDLELNLSEQTARSVRLTFDPIGGSPQGPSGSYNARVISRCFNELGTITGLLTIAEGSSNTRCSLRIVFTANGTRYFLVMSPMYAGTSWATVSCPTDSDSNTTCERWTIAPGTGTGPGTAALYSTARNNKEALVGAYYLSFRIEVTRE